LVFVGFNTHAGYLEKTLSEAIENNNDLRLYCVLPCSIDSVDSKFRQAIFLSPERLIPLSGEEFFPIIRHIVFEDLLNKLFRTRVSQRKKYFKGGNAPIYQIEDSEFDRAKECVKHEIVKQDRTSFQRFLQEVLREQGRRHKYVSFRYQSDKMEVLFFWLTVLRLNYEEFIFCTTSFSHLLMQKDDREIPMLIVNGDNRDHIDLIYQQLNRQIEQDREFRHYIKNVFVYNAEGYTSQAETPAEVGSGRLIERDPHKVVNASSIDYFSLTDHKMYEFLREFDLERFRQNLDDQPWRL
jgi:hypothetical protein